MMQMEISISGIESSPATVEVSSVKGGMALYRTTSRRFKVCFLTRNHH